MGILHLIPARLQFEHPPSALSHFVFRCLQKSQDRIALGALLVGELTRVEPERVSETEESALVVFPGSGDPEADFVDTLVLLLSMEHDVRWVLIIFFRLAPVGQRPAKALCNFSVGLDLD